VAPVEAVNVVYTPRAVRHLHALARQLVKRSPQRQREVFAAVRAAIAILAEHGSDGVVAGEVPLAQAPLSGRSRRRVGVRAVAVSGLPTLVLFRADDRNGRIVILALLETAPRND